MEKINGDNIVKLIFDDKILIKPIEEEKKDGLIIIPEMVNKDYGKGLVVRVGPGTVDVKMLVNNGDCVIYNKRAGTVFEFIKEKYTLLRQSDLYCTIDE